MISVNVRSSVQMSQPTRESVKSVVGLRSSIRHFAF